MDAERPIVCAGMTQLIGEEWFYDLFDCRYERRYDRSIYIKAYAEKCLLYKI